MSLSVPIDIELLAERLADVVERIVGARSQTAVSPVALSMTDAAIALGISRAQAYRLRDRGDFPPTFKMGGKWVVPVAPMREWVREQAARESSDGDAESVDEGTDGRAAPG